MSVYIYIHFGALARSPPGGVAHSTEEWVIHLHKPERLGTIGAGKGDSIFSVQAGRVQPSKNGTPLVLARRGVSRCTFPFLLLSLAGQDPAVRTSRACPYRQTSQLSLILEITVVRLRAPSNVYISLELDTQAQEKCGGGGEAH